MNPAQLRKILKSKKLKKLKKQDKISESIKGKLQNWSSNAKKSIFNKKSLDIEYRKKLKKKVLEFLRTKKVGCANINQLVYFVDQHHITKHGLKLLGCGTNGCALQTCIDKSCNTQIVVKLGVIENMFDYSSENHPNKVEVKLYRMMNTFLLDNKSPHYTFFYGSFNCGMSTLDLIDNYSKRTKMKRKLIEQKFNASLKNNVQVMIVEKAETDLDYYLKKYFITMDIWLNIIFQVCYMLVLTQYNCPGFRHNDLKPDNILVDKYIPVPNSFIKYIIFGKEYYLPDIGVRVKLWDLDFATMDSQKNDKVEDSWSNVFGCNSEYNSIYDMHTLLNIIYVSNHRLSSEIKEWIEFYLTTNDENIIEKLKEEKQIAKSEDEYIISGYETFLTSYGRLTGSKLGIQNLVPDDIVSPGDMLITDDDTEFEVFLVHRTESEISKIYDSQISNISLDYAKTRRDIFNSILN